MKTPLIVLAALFLASCAGSAKYTPRDYSAFSCAQMDQEIQVLSKKIKKKDLGRTVKNVGQVALLVGAAAGASWLVPIIGVPAVETVYDTRTAPLMNERMLLRTMQGVHCYRGKLPKAKEDG